MKDLRSCNILGHYNNSLKTPLPPPLTHEEFVLVYLKLYIARGGGREAMSACVCGRRPLLYCSLAVNIPWAVMHT